METNRRDFLKIAGISTLTLIVPGALSLPMAHAKPEAPGLTVRPRTANRWAMAVIPSECPINCTDCVDACHRVHNVADFGNPKDRIKWIWQEPFAHIFPGENYPHLPKTVQHLNLPVLCNQCENPPCVRVCPTKATFKRPDGIVQMDYHRCIGCRFCMAACPYGARSMNYLDPRPFIQELNPDYPTRTKGVVEKCNFCEERLARGLRPACVVACKERALIFGDLDDPRSGLRRLLLNRFSLRRRSHLGTEPQVYYVLRG